jgi:hypothetical protein
MKKLSLICMALLLSTGAPGIALAQQNPSSTWNDSATFRDPYERSADLDRARAQQQARQGGFGPANSNTVYNGDVTNNGYSTYNGPVTNNDSTNAVNLSSYSSSVSQSGNSTSTVTFSSNNAAQSTSQNATSTSANASAGSASTTVGSTNH